MNFPNQPLIHPSAFIHPKAHVENATIGARTKVWQFSSVIRGTVLGEDCSVASNVTLDGLIAEDRVIFSPGVDIAAGFRIASDVFIGPNVVLCNDRWPVVSKHGFRDELLRSGEFVTVIIGRGASIGANAVVLPGVKVGNGAMIAAGSVVYRSVPENMLHTRDASLVPITPQMREKRMVEA